MTAMLLVSAAAPSAAATPAASASTGDAAPFAAVLDEVADAPSSPADARTTADDDARPGPARGRRTSAAATDDVSGPPSALVPGVPSAAAPMPVTAAIALAVLPPPPAAAASAPSGSVTAPSVVVQGGNGVSTAPPPGNRTGPAGVDNPIVKPTDPGDANPGPVDCPPIRVQSTRSQHTTPAGPASSATAAGQAPSDGLTMPAQLTSSGALPTVPPAVTAAAPPTAVAPPAAVAAPPMLQEAAQPALASALAHLRRGPDGVHELEVTLHPADLGTVQIRVTLHQGAMDVTVACAHAAARDALTAALPALHRELAGLSTVDVGIPRHTHGSGGESRVDADAGARDGRRPDTGEQQAERDRRRPPSTSDSFDRWM